MKSNFVASASLFAFVLGVAAAPAQAGHITYEFSGLCDDCAGVEGATLSPGTNLDDGFYQMVSGTLMLADYTPGDFLDPVEKQRQEEEAEQAKKEEAKAKAAKQKADQKSKTAEKKMQDAEAKAEAAKQEHEKEKAKSPGDTEEERQKHEESVAEKKQKADEAEAAAQQAKQEAENAKKEQEKAKQKEAAAKENKKKKDQAKNKNRFSTFSYSGSSLIDPFVIKLADSAFISGQIFADGSLGQDLSIMSNGYSITLNMAGLWTIFSPDGVPQDIGINGSFAAVPAPGALALLGLGLIGLSARRKSV